MGFSAASAGMMAVSSYRQAQGQQASLKYQAGVQRVNAQVAQWEGSDAIRRGQIEEGNQDLKTAALLSDQRASMAANGVDLGEGSPNDVLTTTRFMGDRDAVQIHNNAMKTAWGYQTQADNMLTNAAAYDAERSAINPWMSATGSLLTSAASASASWTAKNASTGQYKNADGTPSAGMPMTASEYATNKAKSWWGNK